ncbi:MAG: hypothetical protein NT048_04760 [Flavobacterium sp.]|jgi:hypothetical protein|nr:hypothetical protein [Flavobacterium sp.]
MKLDITKVQLNPVPLPIVELQEQNVMLKGKNKVFEKVIFGLITAGVITLIYFVIKTADARHNEKD